MNDDTAGTLKVYAGGLACDACKRVTGDVVITVNGRPLCEQCRTCTNPTVVRDPRDQQQATTP